MSTPLQPDSATRGKPFANAAVAQAFQRFSPQVRGDLLTLRALIFETAACTPGVGPLEETLKWGEPAYLTSQSKSGSTIRIGSKTMEPGHYALYFNCQTNLVETFRTLFPHDFEYQGSRAIVLVTGQVVPTDALALCIAAALTYHAASKRKR